MLTSGLVFICQSQEHHAIHGDEVTQQSNDNTADFRVLIYARNAWLDRLCPAKMGVNCAAVLKYPKGVFTPCCKGVSLLALLSFQEGVGKVIIKQVHTTDYTPTEQVFIIQNIMQMHCKDKTATQHCKGPCKFLCFSSMHFNDLCLQDSFENACVGGLAEWWLYTLAQDSLRGFLVVFDDLYVFYVFCILKVGVSAYE